MYPNLKAECAKKNISNRQLAVCINVHENTIANRYKGESHYEIEDAFKIRWAFFPELDLEYLFAAS